MKLGTIAITALLLLQQKVHVAANQDQNKEASITSLPLLSHHHILQRRNLHGISTNPGVTKIHSIPIVRRLDGPRPGATRRDTDETAFNTLEVNGLYQGYGTHYVDLWIGTPPQRQTVIVDTGSGITAFPCQDCADCGLSYHASPFYVESQSSTFEKFKCDGCSGATCRGLGSAEEYCHLSVSYQEGSMWTAYEGKDITYLGGLHDGAVKAKEEGDKLGGQIHGEDPLDAAQFSFDMVFGCQTKITGLFKTQLADGIMGMCLKDSAIFMQMHQQGVIADPSFSLCFVRGEDAAKEGTNAGALTLGGTDLKLHNKQMIYAKGFKTKGVMHGVTIRKVHIMEAGMYGAEDADVSNTHTVEISQALLNTGSVIVDSGTTDTYLTRNLSGPFKTAFKNAIGYDYNENGMTLTDDQVYALPTILIQIEGILGASASDPNPPGLAGKIDPSNPDDILITIPPAHYIEYDADAKKYVGRFSMTEGSGSVIGANTMRGHDVFFDIPNNSRIGFAVSDCDYRSLIGLDPKNVDVETNEQEEQGSDGDGDDYYEEEDQKKLKGGDVDSSTGGDVDKGKTGKIVVGFAVVSLLVVVAYKKISNRNRENYERAVAENEHLNDLVLDTEIQMTEIS